MRPRLAALDWTLVKGSALVSSGMLAARALGFVFSLVLARAFTPSQFGEIQYAIVLAEIIAIGTQPFAQHVLARYIGAYKDKPFELKKYLSNSWLILAIASVGTLFIAIPVLIALDKLNTGILIIFIGTTLFYAYWGLSRGYLASGRLVIAYLGANAAQLLLVFLLIQGLGIKSTRLALVIYGAAHILPLFVLQALAPIPIHYNRRLISRDATKTILIFSLPIWLSHAAYMLNTTLDILLVEHFSDPLTLGRYSLAKTISVIFVFAPSGISTILMPRIASLPRQSHRKLLIDALILTLGINGSLFLFYLILGRRLIGSVFGPEYLSSPEVLLLLPIGMIIMGVYSVFAAVMVGSGKAHYETISRLVMLCVSVVTGWLLIPIYGGLGAALMIVIASMSGILVSALIVIRNRRRV